MQLVTRLRSPAGARRRRLGLTTLAAAVWLAGCATRSADVRPSADDPRAYAEWTCVRLFDELDQVQARAADVAYAVDARVGNNMIALGLGVTVFWPALLAMRPDGPEATELAALKGRYEALRTAAATRRCGSPPEAMSADRQAALPVRQGDRLVYEDRLPSPRSARGAQPVRQVGLRVAALRRDGIEFSVDVDGRALEGRWRQDLSGNLELENRAPLIGWQRLLKSDLRLGQVVYGDLASAGEALPAARVRGQVVAVGPKLISGRRFDVAVIELYGDAPAQPRTVDIAGGSTRLDGVMSVDRNSGVLVRLELRSANPDFQLNRRLVAIEGQEPAGDRRDLGASGAHREGDSPKGSARP
jgi:hypothetical protein